MLLPTTSGTKSILKQVEQNSSLFDGAAVGLFLPDVFINLSRTVSVLQKAKVNWVCNLPTTGQYDNEFKQYLSEVEMGVQKEIEMLSAFKKLGFKTLAIISSEKDALAFAHSKPDALGVIPQAATFSAGFPSLKLRISLESEVHTALENSGFKGAYLAYRSHKESVTEVQSHMVRPILV